MDAHRTRRSIHAVMAAALALPAVVLMAQQPAAPDNNPLLGHWILVVDKSLYNPGPPPLSQRRTYETHPKGLKTTVRTVHADGQSTTVEYTANYDSIEYRVTGSPEIDGIALKRIDAYSAEATLTHAGRVTGVARRVVSPDGRTMRITFRDARGVIHNEAVYEKGKPGG